MIVYCLILILILILITQREPKVFVQLKERYAQILSVLQKTGDPTWTPVLTPSILTGMRGWSRAQGAIGSNVNKGYEIYICLDGDDVNSATYVLMHEMAHMSVPEYSHSDHFWDNFKKLKKICIDAGLYEPTGTRGYCGDTLID